MFSSQNEGTFGTGTFGTLLPATYISNITVEAIFLNFLFGRCFDNAHLRTSQ